MPGSEPGVKSYEADRLAQARRRIKDLEAELKLVKAAERALQRGGRDQPKRKYQVVRGLNNLGYSERIGCRVVGLHRSTYYDIKFHQPSTREIRHLLLADLIADIHARSRGTYGMLRIRAALRSNKGSSSTRSWCGRSCASWDSRACRDRRRASRNLVNAATEEDLVQRNFVATGPQRAVADRHHRTSNPRGQGLLLCSPGSVQPQGRWLGDRSALRGHPRQRRAVDGRRDAGALSRQR